MLQQIFALSGDMNSGRKDFYLKCSRFINLFIEDFISRSNIEFGSDESILNDTSFISDMLSQEHRKLCDHIATKRN